MNRDAGSRLVHAGVLSGLTDGLFSIILAAFFYHSTVARLFQGVASVSLGKGALDGGTATALIGVLMHFGVAFGWSAVFLFWSCVYSGCVNSSRLDAGWSPSGLPLRRPR